MDESYEIAGRQAATPRVGNEVVAVIEVVGPAAVVCRGCSYWLTRVGEGVVCSECGLATGASLAGDWIGAAERGAVERLRTSAKWTVFGLGGLLVVVGVMIAFTAIGLLRSEKMAIMLAFLGLVGGGMTYLVMQCRTQTLMGRMGGRGRVRLGLSVTGTVGVAVWLMYLMVMAGSELAGRSPRGWMVDVFQFLSLWIAPPSGALMMAAGGLGFGAWARVLGNDRGFVKGTGMVAGVLGALGLLVSFAGIIVHEVVWPLVWRGPAPDPMWRVIVNYAEVGAVVGGIGAGVMVLVNGVVWVLVWRRCGWVLRERAKTEGGAGE